MTISPKLEGFTASFFPNDMQIDLCQSGYFAIFFGITKTGVCIKSDSGYFHDRMEWSFIMDLVHLEADTYPELTLESLTIRCYGL